MIDDTKDVERGEDEKCPLPDEVPVAEASAGPGWLKKCLWAAALVALLLVVGAGVEYNRRVVVPGRIVSSADDLLMGGSYEMALERYREALNMRARLEGVNYKIAYANEELGRYIEAVDYYAAHLENNPWDTEALVRLGSIYLRFDMYNDAVLLFEEAASRVPDNPDVIYALSVVYERLGRAEKAAESYIWLTGSSEVTDPEVLINSSRALMKLGQYVDALDGFTRANALLPSDDKRAFHGMNAARGMLGWPTDDSVVVTPGKSIGSIRIGVTSRDVLGVWGKPVDIVTEGEHELWSYGTSIEELSSFVFFQEGRVIEIVTKSMAHRTSDGLGLGNFLEPKYADRFDRWVDDGEDPAAYRYILKGGGLALYSTSEPTAVIYSGDIPLSTEVGREWRAVEN